MSDEVIATSRLGSSANTGAPTPSWTLNTKRLTRNDPVTYPKDS
jgi:hypothetical protein